KPGRPAKRSGQVLRPMSSQPTSSTVTSRVRVSAGSQIRTPGRSFRFGILQLLLLVIAWSTPAWARSYKVSDFATTIHVDEDGSARIKESISFVFSGVFQGVYRDIPVEYPGPKGSNYSLFVTVKSVTDENGSALKYEKSTTSGYLHLKIFVPG